MKLKFIDMHNHIMYGIDDGAKTLEETIQLLKLAANTNVEQLIVTPHFKENIFHNQKNNIETKVNEIKQILLEHNIDMNIYPGSEIFLSKNTLDLLNNQKLQTLNNSQYVLIETHMVKDYQMINVREELYNLKIDGYQVILAHPERYENTRIDPNFVYDLVSDGYYMQINVNSLKENHPNHKIVKKLLDNNLVHFVASDSHNLSNRPPLLDKGYQFVEKHYGKDYANDLFYNNPLSVINNEQIKIRDFQKIKSKKFFFF